MSKINPLLNDTFDNISFTEIGKCLNEEEFKKPSNAKNKRLSRKHDVHCITFDDSQFFSESFNLPNDYNSFASDSEDLFGESGCDLDVNFTSDWVTQNENCSKIKNGLVEECLINENTNQDSENKLESYKPTICTQIACTTECTLYLDNCNKGTVDCETRAITLTKCQESQNANDEAYNIVLSSFTENGIIPADGIKSPNQKIKNTDQLSGNFLELASLNLPEAILQKYRSRNVITMFKWQVECLNTKDVLLMNKNLVYSAPTSAGKTLVAEILSIKTILERKKKVIFVLPFVSVVREKMFYFQDIFSTSGVRVEGYMGSHTPPGDFKTIQLAVCTIEKANSIINKMLGDGTLSDIGAVVIDEMHLLGDSSRGYLLELMLTKLRYMSLKEKEINIQIVGMSATLPNLDLLAKWLDAELYTTTFRPIPLFEYCHFNGEIYSNDLKLVRRLEPIKEIENDTDNILQLCLETISSSCSVLIFCPTKNWCENLAQQISMAIWKLGSTQSDISQLLRKQLNTEAIAEMLEQLKRCPVGLDKILRKTVAFGTAFHHAGLTMDERDIIEGAFRSGTIRILVATSTLSSGVNLPARRVIIRTPIYHGKPIDILTYRQMIGRAGRMGKDTAGESILICQKNENKIVKEIMTSGLLPIESCLEGSGKLKRAILEVIASGVACNPDDVKLFTNCTLLAVDQEQSGELCSCIKESVDFLMRNEFVRLQEIDGGTFKYFPTALGKACLSSSMPPEEGLSLFAELEKARQCLALDTELHLIYLATPYSACYQWSNIDWMHFLDMWEKLPKSMKRVGDLVGISESYIVNSTRGKMQTNTSKQLQKLLLHKRFYTALALQDLVNEVPLGEVALKFSCSRGVLQSLQQSASSFAGMVTSFTRQLGWSNIEILISQFQDRLQFGINRDLLDLMRLPILNATRARALFNSGIETIAQLATANNYELENILHKATPFQREKEREDDNHYEHEERNKLRCVWITGMHGLTEKEAASMLINDARTYIKFQMGIADAKWDTDKSDSDNINKDISSTSSPNKSCTKRTSQEQINGEILDDNNTTSESFNLQLSTASSNINSPQHHGDQAKNNSTLNSTNGSVSLFESSEQSLFDNSVADLSTLEKNHESNLLSTSNNLSDVSIDLTISTNLEKAFVSSFNHDECNTKEGFKSNYIICSSNLNGDNNNMKGKKRFYDESDDIDIFNGDYIPASSYKKSKSDQQEYSNENKEKYTKEETNITSDFTAFEIVNVCDSNKLFDSFCKEIVEKFKLSFSLACSKIQEIKHVIGKNLANKDQIGEKATQDKTDRYTYKSCRVNGFSFMWDANVAYYISLENEDCVKNYAKINLLKGILSKPFLNVKIFDSKEQIKLLKLCCGIDVMCEIEDPKIGDWILQPEEREKSLQAMALKYAPEMVKLAQLAGSCKGVGSVGLNLHSAIDPKIRASVECIVCWYLVDSVKEAITEVDKQLISVYCIEMGNLLCLTKMELNGIGVSVQKLQNLVELIKEQINALENRAHQLAGRKFSFTSSVDVAKVIGIYKGKKVSTSKQVLEQSEHPISCLIMHWRKLNSTLTKMVYPLLQKVENNRIHGSTITNNATGRVSMHEPNLQNIPKDFELINPVTNAKVLIKCRSSFIAPGNNILLSADYCQIELRLLAHLSKDTTLCSVMNTKQDVFKSIAAKWNGIKESQVNDVMRQRAKQICYGIIYGMGVKTLAEQLEITEEEASNFVDSFHKKYKGIRTFINKVIEQCKQTGYVETITGRRRYLPNVNNDNQAIKSQAERQAVNTTVQGSAADIVKKAMVLIDRDIEEKFKTSRKKPKLILQLHDELLFEVPSKYKTIMAKVLQQNMEESVQLSVPFPVKLKSGPSWGDMKEIYL